MGVVNAKPRPLYPRERDPVHIVQEPGWAPGPVWSSAKNFAPTGIPSPDRPVSKPTELSRLLKKNMNPVTLKEFEASRVECDK
jgi:hypothetical protein